jgi:hypothetical protein
VSSSFGGREVCQHTVLSTYSRLGVRWGWGGGGAKRIVFFYEILENMAKASL